MPSCDTNVLVRYLVADDLPQYKLSCQLIESTTKDDPLFIPLSVCVELEWVLRTAYDFDKNEIIDVFIQLLRTNDVAFQNEASLELALSTFSETNADFTDCLHVAIAYSQEQWPFMTFDRKASKLPGAELL